MKLKFKYLLIFLIGIISYSKNVDDFINEYKNKSYTTKINNLNMKSYNIKDKLYEKGDWNEISISVNNNYEKSKNYNGINIDTTLNYGWLYYKNGIDFTNKEITENKIGISKEINDFFFSKNEYNKRINNINKDKQEINNENIKNSEIRDLIDLYKNYKNKEKEIEQGKISFEEKEKDYIIISKKYELGESSQFDYNLAKIEYEKSQLENENLIKELKILGERFMIFNINLQENEILEDLTIEELNKDDFYNLRLSEAETIKLSEILNEEQTKKYEFDYKYPKVTADAGYSFEKKNFTVGVGISKTFKKYNSEIEDLKNETEKLKLEYEKKKKELISNVGQEMINYTTYQTDELIKQKSLEIAKEETEIYAKRYELGVDTYSNYVQKRNVYNKAIIDYEKSKNELAAFTKKIKYYK